MTRLVSATSFAMSRAPVSRLAAILLSMAAGLVSPGLTAAAETPRKDAAARPGGDAILTPAQLRACMTQQDQLRAQTDDAMKERAAIDRERAELDRADTALGAEVASVDRASSDAVDAHNAKVQVQEQRARALGARMAAYNVKAEAVLASKASHQQACGNRRYDDRDLDDLKRKKK